MAFTILANSTPADEVKANDDFYHIGQGTRLPLGGANLIQTTSVFHLGSLTKKYKDIFCNNIIANKYNDTEVINVIYGIEITSSAYSLNITGITSTVKEIFFICDFLGAAVTTTIMFFANGDSNSSYYNMSHYGVGIAFDTTTGTINLISLNSASSTVINGSIYINSTYSILIETYGGGIAGKSVFGNYFDSVTSSPLSSILFNFSEPIRTGSSVYVWTK